MCRATHRGLGPLPEVVVSWDSHHGLSWDYHGFHMMKNPIPLILKTIRIIWVNYNISLTWIKAIWGWFPLRTMIPVRSQWGRYNLPRIMRIMAPKMNRSNTKPGLSLRQLGDSVFSFIRVSTRMDGGQDGTSCRNGASFSEHHLLGGPLHHPSWRWPLWWSSFQEPALFVFSSWKACDPIFLGESWDG